MIGVTIDSASVEAAVTGTSMAAEIQGVVDSNPTRYATVTVNAIYHPVVLAKNDWLVQVPSASDITPLVAVVEIQTASPTSASDGDGGGFLGVGMVVFLLIVIGALVLVGAAIAVCVMCCRKNTASVAPQQPNIIVVASKEQLPRTWVSEEQFVAGYVGATPGEKKQHEDEKEWKEADKVAA